MMSWEAIREAGASVKADTSMEMSALEDSLGTARAAARKIVVPVDRGKHKGQFTGLAVAKFQQELYARNAEWHFTDRTLCVLWRLELPNAMNYFEHPEYVWRTRNDVNRGKHSGGNPKPEQKYVGYDVHGAPIDLPERQAANSGSGVAPIQSSDAGLWDQFILWASRFHALPDFDDSERDYKLTIARNIQAARDAIASGDPEWPKALRRAFGAPNNLTNFIAHSRLLDWSLENAENASLALLDLWQSEESGGCPVRC